MLENRTAQCFRSEVKKKASGNVEMVPLNLPLTTPKHFGLGLHIHPPLLKNESNKRNF